MSLLLKILIVYLIIGEAVVGVSVTFGPRMRALMRRGSMLRAISICVFLVTTWPIALKRALCA